MGWDVQVKQIKHKTSKAGQILRLHYSIWKKLYIQFYELLEASAV